MKRLIGLSLLALVALLPACAWDPIPRGPNINVNGTYLGRIVGSNNQSALLDVTVVEKNLNVTATVTSRTTQETFTMLGTRSVYDASPVRVNVMTSLGSGSRCAGGVQERYGVDVSFYKDKKDVGLGNVTHEVCNASTGQFEHSSVNSGALELTRK